MSLHELIADLLASTEPKSVSLPAGARLDWTPETRTLSATRLNRGLETQPSEQRVFEAHIRRAGYEHERAEPHVQLIGFLDDERIGVKWKVMPAKRKEISDAQLSLF